MDVQYSATLSGLAGFGYNEKVDKSAILTRVLSSRWCKTVKDRSILVGQTVANLYTVHARDYVAIATS